MDNCAHARFAKFTCYMFSNLLWIWRKKLCGLQIHTFHKFHKTKQVKSNKKINSFNKLIHLMNYTNNELEQLYNIWYNIAKNLEKVRETCPKAPTKVTPIIATIILNVMLCLEEITLPNLKYRSQLIHSYRIHLFTTEWMKAWVYQVFTKKSDQIIKDLLWKQLC